MRGTQRCERVRREYTVDSWSNYTVDYWHNQQHNIGTIMYKKILGEPYSRLLDLFFKPRKRVKNKTTIYSDTTEKLSCLVSLDIYFLWLFYEYCNQRARAMIRLITRQSIALDFWSLRFWLTGYPIESFTSWQTSHFCSWFVV